MEVRRPQAHDGRLVAALVGLGVYLVQADQLRAYMPWLATAAGAHAISPAATLTMTRIDVFLL
jgi:hypothetical protein